METETSKRTPVDLGSKMKGEIELPSLDVSQYVGRKARIEKVEEFEGDYGYYIKMSTTVVDMPKDAKTGQPIKDKSSTPMELRATRLFGLQTDADGNLGWGKKTKLGVFLAKHHVGTYKDMVGREVIVQTVTNKDSGKDFLTF